MTIKDILTKVNEERKIQSRYPLRVILCNSLQGYRTLVNELKNVCDCTINLGEFCAANDVHPRFRSLEKHIEKEKDKQVLLLSISEYLRYAIKRENSLDEYAQFDAFWSRQTSVDSYTRVYIPLFAAKDLFKSVVKNVNERQEDFVWNLDDTLDTTVYQVAVYSDKFAEALGSEAIIGFKNWLLKWDEVLEKGNIDVVTARFSDSEESFGTVAVTIVENPYEYLCKGHPEISTIAIEQLPEELWAILYSDIRSYSSVDDAILSTINLQQFDTSVIATQWESLSQKGKYYVWIWFQLHAPENYVGNIIHKLNANELDLLSLHIANDILPYVDTKPDWVKERKGLMMGIKNVVPTQEFFCQLDTYAPQKVFSLLTGTTQDERAYIVKTVCRWLRNGGYIADCYQEIIKEVEPIYPELAWYMETPENLYSNYQEYFKWYKKHKLINRYVEEPLKHPDYEDLKTRYAVLANYNGLKPAILWIDGFGIEWLSLACKILDNEKGNAFDYTAKYAAARLPSETEFNHQWKETDVKRDRLDKLAHNGMPDDIDYFSCISNQIRIVKELIREAISMLSSNDCVIITGDHGSSRLAALAFHQKTYTFLPDGATAMAFGRFCLLSKEPNLEDILENVEECSFEGEKYLVMKDYNHYKQKGNAAGGNTDENAVAGELHGGLTPEETVVPVIVLRRKTALRKIQVVKGDSILRIKGGKAVRMLEFTAPVSRLEIAPSAGRCSCFSTDNPCSWEIRFEGLSGETIELSIVANGKMMKEVVRWTLKNPLESNFSMGGLP